MNHLRLLLYLLAALAGAASIAQTFLIRQRYRKAVIRRYGWFLLSLFLLLLGFSLQLYARIVGWEGTAAARHAVWILFAAGGLSFIFCAPPFYHSLLGLAQPMYFLALNVLTILFGLRYLNRPAYSQEGRRMEHFVAAFKITGREQEIILQLVKAAGVQEIATRLFISPKTVENHIYNIYQNLGVKNRAQLFQLIRANALD